MDLFPVFLRIAGEPCLVVGGGRVALRRARSLSRAGARVTVVSPRFLESFMRLPGAKLTQRAFRAADVTGNRRAYRLVIAATDDPAVNAVVARLCRARRIWVNVADNAASGDFHVPSVFRRGPLALAVTTGGSSPALAKILGRRARRLFGPDVRRAALTLRRLRKRLRTLPASERRRQIQKVLSKEGLSKI